MNYLTQQFGRQTLSSDTRMSRPYDYAVNYQTSYQMQQGNMQSSSDSPYSSSPLDYSQSYASSQQYVRSQRQANSRLQCDPSRAREISTLADRITATSNDQCYVCQPQLQSTYIHPDPEPNYDADEFDDEGIDMTSEDVPSLDLSYRRSTDFTPTEGRVQRQIRIRKKTRPKGGSSSRMVG